jgi:NADH-quinone oxidoreductase subunit M
MSILMWLFIVPFISSLIVLIAFGLSAKKIKILSVILSLIPLALLILNHGNWIGSKINYQWLPLLSINFHLAIDSLSLVFLYLTAVIVPISILAMSSSRITYPNVFYALILFSQGLLIGFFTARDLALFTIFWEAMLLPLYFIITIWGGAQRQAAAFTFLIYMIAGSALMVAAVLALYVDNGTHTFDIDALAKTAAIAPHAAWLLAIFLLAFAVKTPLFPFHAWLPDAYCQAPTTGTILLSALLSKAGIYGILRIAIGFFPDLLKEWSPILLGLSIAGVFYGGLAAWMQNDFKRLIAYSSFSHVNFILVGLFAWHLPAETGAILQALNHGITITALFLVAGWLEDRLGTTSMSPAGGLAKFMPSLCWLTLFFVLSSVALPGTNSFIGELLIFFGLFGVHPWLTAFLGLTVVLSVIYMLRFMQKIYFEEPSTSQKRWNDIKGREFVIALPLIALILWIGFYPAPILKQIQTTTTNSEVQRIE